jgi:hypothetical protein
VRGAGDAAPETRRIVVGSFFMEETARGESTAATLGAAARRGTEAGSAQRLSWAAAARDGRAARARVGSPMGLDACVGLASCAGLAACVGAIAGCTGEASSGGPDGGAADAGGADAGARVDAGPEPGPDAGPTADAGPGPGGDGGAGADAGPPDDTLSARYPGDVGMGADPAVVWFEDFEAGSLAGIAARYNQTRDDGRWSLVRDTPLGRGSALALRAGNGREAVDLYKQLPDHDEWYVRWYAKYQPGMRWHHSGMWFGGTNPSQRWPSPNVGRRPRGDDRFSVAVEPVYGEPSLRFDFDNCWMRTRSWMAEPVMDTGSAFYGNGLLHRNDFTVDEGTWVCLEAHLRLNPDPTTGAGAVLEVWKNDRRMRRFDDAGPRGYWVRDKFCPADSDGRECTDCAAPPTETLDLQQRSTTALRLNAFWPQNDITAAGVEGTLTFDQMVVATRRVGCAR